MNSQIEVSVNGDVRHFPREISVEQLLEQLSLNPALIVVERNGTILRRPHYTEITIENGDALELVHFVGGG
ncbi:MAG TPA: sulfur carrier protein ThiS [Longimicrobiaceae bacterium]|nr:sulfur carrier protein ThiS [Longimicrobiaceae bacterium]